MKKNAFLLSLLAAVLAAPSLPARAQTADDLAALSSRERARFVCKYHAVIARAQQTSQTLATDILLLRQQMETQQKQLPACTIVPVQHRQKCPTIPILNHPVMCAQVLWTDYARKCDAPEQTAPATIAPAPDLLRAKLAQAEELFHLNTQWLKTTQNACHTQVNAMSEREAWRYYQATSQ